MTTISDDLNELPMPDYVDTGNHMDDLNHGWEVERVIAENARRARLRRQGEREGQPITDFVRIHVDDHPDPKHRQKADLSTLTQVMKRSDQWMLEAFAARDAIDILNRRIAELEAAARVAEPPEPLTDAMTAAGVRSFLESVEGETTWHPDEGHIVYGRDIAELVSTIYEDMRSAAIHRTTEATPDPAPE